MFRIRHSEKYVQFHCINKIVEIAKSVGEKPAYRLLHKLNAMDLLLERLLRFKNWQWCVENKACILLWLNMRLAGRNRLTHALRLIDYGVLEMMINIQRKDICYMYIEVM